MRRRDAANRRRACRGRRWRKNSLSPHLSRLHGSPNGRRCRRPVLLQRQRLRLGSCRSQRLNLGLYQPRPCVPPRRPSLHPRPQYLQPTSRRRQLPVTQLQCHLQRLVGQSSRVQQLQSLRPALPRRHLPTRPLQRLPRLLLRRQPPPQISHRPLALLRSQRLPFSLRSRPLRAQPLPPRNRPSCHPSLPNRPGPMSG